MPYKDKDAQREAQRKHYEENKGRYAASSRRNRERRYKKYYALKNNPCVDCGRKYPFTMMHFDHREAGAKDGHLSRMITNVGWNTLLAEVAKCDLVCVVCHGIRTIERAIEAGTASQMLIDSYEEFKAQMPT